MEKRQHPNSKFTRTCKSRLNRPKPPTLNDKFKFDLSPQPYMSRSFGGCLWCDVGKPLRDTSKEVEVDLKVRRDHKRRLFFALGKQCGCVCSEEGMFSFKDGFRWGAVEDA